MPKGPQGQLRPGGAAIMVTKIATSELHEKLTTPGGELRSGKAEARMGGATLTAEKRSSIARNAASSYWQ